MTDVLDLLVAAGARVDSIVLGAAAGDLTGWPVEEASEEDRLLALIMAADHQRLDVIDALLEAGTPIDAEDDTFGRQALRLAAERGRARSVEHLLARGVDRTTAIPSRAVPRCTGAGAARNTSSSRPVTTRSTRCCPPRSGRTLGFPQQ